MTGVRQKEAGDATQVPSHGATTAAGTGAWTPEEHAQFIRGCELHGWGNWKAIEHCVPTRARAQVKSHAQKWEQAHPEEKRALQQDPACTRTARIEVPRKKRKTGTSKINRLDVSSLITTSRIKTEKAPKKHAKTSKSTFSSPMAKAEEPPIPKAGVPPPPIFDMFRSTKANTAKQEARTRTSAGAPGERSPVKARKIPEHEPRVAIPPEKPNGVKTRSEKLASHYDLRIGRIASALPAKGREAPDSPLAAKPLLPESEVLGQKMSRAPEKKKSRKRTAAANENPASGPGAATWSFVEQEQFKEGCVRYAWGSWKFTEKHIPTRSYTQVKSHAQKFREHRPVQHSWLAEEHGVCGRVTSATKKNPKKHPKTKTSEASRKCARSSKCVSQTKVLSDAGVADIAANLSLQTAPESFEALKKPAKLSKCVQTKAAVPTVPKVATKLPLNSKSRLSKADSAQPEGERGKTDAVVWEKHVNALKCIPKNAEWKLPVDLSCHADSLPVVRHGAATADGLETLAGTEDWCARHREIKSAVQNVGITPQTETRTEVAVGAQRGTFSKASLCCPQTNEWKVPIQHGAPPTAYEPEKSLYAEKSDVSKHDLPCFPRSASLLSTGSPVAMCASLSQKKAGAGQWSFAEQEQFKNGCIQHGWGSWKAIQRCIPTRSYNQVKSHAQKFQKHRPGEKRKLETEHRLRSKLTEKGESMVLEGEAIISKIKDLGEKHGLPTTDTASLKNEMSDAFRSHQSRTASKQHERHQQHVGREASPGKTRADKNKTRVHHVLLGSSKTLGKKAQPHAMPVQASAENIANPFDHRSMTQGVANKVTDDDYGAAEVILSLNNVVRQGLTVDSGDNENQHLTNTEASRKFISEGVGSANMATTALYVQESTSYTTDKVGIEAPLKPDNALYVELDKKDEELATQETNYKLWDIHKKGRTFSDDTSSVKKSPQLECAPNRLDDTITHNSQPPPHWLAAKTWEQCLRKIHLWNDHLSAEQKQTEYLKFSRLTGGEKKRLRRKLVALMNNRPLGLPASD